MNSDDLPSFATGEQCTRLLNQAIESLVALGHHFSAQADNLTIAMLLHSVGLVTNSSLEKSKACKAAVESLNSVVASIKEKMNAPATSMMTVVTLSAALASARQAIVKAEWCLKNFEKDYLSSPVHLVIGLRRQEKRHQVEHKIFDDLPVARMFEAVEIHNGNNEWMEASSNETPVTQADIEELNLLQGEPKEAEDCKKCLWLFRGREANNKLMWAMTTCEFCNCRCHASSLNKRLCPDGTHQCHGCGQHWTPSGIKKAVDLRIMQIKVTDELIFQHSRSGRREVLVVI